MAVKPLTPVWLERLVRRCLAKDPEDRWQSMRDVVLELRAPVEEAFAGPAKVSRWPWAVAVMSLVAALGWTAWQQKPREAPAPATFDIHAPEGGRSSRAVSVGGSAISPDGRTLAFVGVTAKGETLLHVRPLDSLEARALPGTEYAGQPFWSPDSKSLAFLGGGKLNRIDLAGGSPVALCDAPSGRGGTWSEDGVILFGTAQSALQRIPAAGGTPSSVTRLNRGSRRDGAFLSAVSAK